MDSIALNFHDFSDYERKLASYLNQNDLLESFEECRIMGIKKLVDKFDLTNNSDVNQLAFLMWMLTSEFEKILNEYLIEKIDLCMFEEKLKQNTPKIEITGWAGANPLGGPRGNFQGALAYYDCLKFIGQFTNSQKIYDKCLGILRSMPLKLDGPIMDPPNIIYLMKYNKYVNIDNVRDISKSSHLNNHYDFYHSIYKPNPSQEYEYNRYKVDIQQSYYNMAQSGDFVNNKSSSVSYICFLDKIINSHWNIIEDMDDFKHQSRLKINISHESRNIIKKILMDISEQNLQNNLVPIQPNEDSINKIINNKLRFITSEEDGIGDIQSIFIDAYCYVSDEKYETEILKRKILIELFERKIVDPDSKLAHNLMRNAADNGILWIVKFLVGKGCRTKDLPPYGAWPWVLESQQLVDILAKDLKIYDSYRKEYIEKKNAARKIVHEYLLNNNLI